MSKATKVNISTYEDFNKAVASGKVTTDDFYNALADYADKNFGGAVELMSNTLDGLEATMGDIKEYALGDTFKPFGDSFAKAFTPIVGGLADFLGVGGFKDFGEKIAKWAKPGLNAIEKFRKNITGKQIKQVLKDVQQYLGDTAKSGISLKAILEATFGEKAGGAIFGFFEKLRKPLAWINEHKDAIIGGAESVLPATSVFPVFAIFSSNCAPFSDCTVSAPIRFATVFCLKLYFFIFLFLNTFFAAGSFKLLVFPVMTNPSPIFFCNCFCISVIVFSATAPPASPLNTMSIIKNNIRLLTFLRRMDKNALFHIDTKFLLSSTKLIIQNETIGLWAFSLSSAPMISVRKSAQLPIRLQSPSKYLPSSFQHQFFVVFG